MVELFDYRLFFPAEFTVSDVGIKLDLFNNEIEIGGNRYGFKQKTHVWGGEIRVDAELDGKNIEGKNLVLSFYQDGEVGSSMENVLVRLKELELMPSLN